MFKATSAQTALLHAAESLGVAALMTIVAALYQYFILRGFNVQGLVGVASLGFIGAFSTVYKAIAANPNLAPAIADTLAEIKSTIEQHTQAISFIQQAMQAAQAPASQVPQLQFPVQSAPLGTGTQTTFTPQQMTYQPSSSYPSIPKQ